MTPTGQELPGFSLAAAHFSPFCAPRSFPENEAVTRSPGDVPMKFQPVPELILRRIATRPFLVDNPARAEERSHPNAHIQPWNCGGTPLAGPVRVEHPAGWDSRGIYRISDSGVRLLSGPMWRVIGYLGMLI